MFKNEVMRFTFTRHLWQVLRRTCLLLKVVHRGYQLYEPPLTGDARGQLYQR